MLGCFITEMASLRKLLGLVCLSCFLQICTDLPARTPSSPPTGSNQDPQQVDGLVGGNVTLPLEYNYVGEELFWSYNDNDTGRIVYIALIRTNGKPTEYYPLKYKLDSTGSLKIICLQKEDSRVYQADVPKGKKFKKNYSLSVYTEPKPRVEICPDTCVLLCSVENDSNVTLSWLKGDGTILNKTSSVNETTLALSHDMLPDNVTYTCVASNPASNRTTNVTCHSNRWTDEMCLRSWSSTCVLMGSGQRIIWIRNGSSLNRTQLGLSRDDVLCVDSNQTSHGSLWDCQKNEWEVSYTILIVFAVVILAGLTGCVCWCKKKKKKEPEPSIQRSSYHNDASEKDNDTSDYDDDDDNDIGDMAVKEKSSLIQNGQNTDS
ncbi:uncharacterized protein LOC131696681 isoform X1 [Acipenser ruthenus]|uniref:uncharacterized protein LOC131696681 isoform X1 n=2 Tax=Acipenser ruthenus TaxID=7906 RepID=UPI0027421C05|nr:uncharacterized protein LOC131696681 isoform X1 [Acipenser ruthenus]